MKGGSEKREGENSSASWRHATEVGTIREQDQETIITFPFFDVSDMFAPRLKIYVGVPELLWTHANKLVSSGIRVRS